MSPSHGEVSDAPEPTSSWISELTIAEAERKSAEIARGTAETGREEAESDRNQAEAERREAETGREEAEEARKLAEQAREEAESLRVEAEATRMGFKPMGAYNPANENKYGEWYTHEGGSYGYIWPEPSTGVPLSDTTHWQQIASVGGQDILDAVTAEKNAAIAAKVLAEGYAAQLAAGTASPAGTYANLAALNSGTPTAPNTAKIYITRDDGKWCYHNGSAWVAGGVYQAISGPASSITVADAGIYFPGANAEDAIKSIGEDLHGISVLPTNQNSGEGTLTPTHLTTLTEQAGRPKIEIVANTDGPMRRRISYKHVLSKSLADAGYFSCNYILPDLSDKPTKICHGYWIKDSDAATVFSTTKVMRHWIYNTGKYITIQYNMHDAIASVGSSPTVTKATPGAGLIDSFDAAVTCLAKDDGYSYVMLTFSSIVWNAAFTAFDAVLFYYEMGNFSANLVGNELNICNITMLYDKDITDAYYVYPDGLTVVQYPRTDPLLTQIEDLEDKVGNVLYGKTIAAAGDSITYGSNPGGGLFKNYAQLIAERNGMTAYNYGISGSTLSNIAGHNPFTGRWNSMAASLDYILIWFGWNDAAYSTVGTIDDAVNTTFYGAWNEILPGLIAKYPLAKIGLVVPYMAEAFETFKQAVRDIGAKWGLPVLDLDADDTPLIWLRDGVDPTIAELRRSTFTYDTTHPNQAGYDYMSTFIEAFVRRL